MERKESSAGTEGQATPRVSVERPIDAWSAFWSELLARLQNIELTSRASTKFEECAAWIAAAWGFGSGEVVCKYVQHPKNRWNRLREASRRDPRALMLLLEGAGHGELEPHIEEAASQCSSLNLVVVLVRPMGCEWQPSAFLTRSGTALPSALQGAIGKVACVEFTGSNVIQGGPLPTPAAAEATNLRASLFALAALGGEPTSSHRGIVLGALGALTGLPGERLGFKTIPSIKNLGNRLGEALGRRLDVVILVCPEALQVRVVDELGRWESASDTAILLVLLGEETTFEVRGPRSELTNRLRSAVELPLPPEERHAQDQPTGSWRGWTYVAWNEVLAHYCLRVADGDESPVERIAATPEEVAVAAGADPEEADAVASAFVQACVAQLPRGTSFCGFCTKHAWSSASDDVPPFFGMLWFTCLVAYGYPTADGGFFERLWNLMGNKDHVKCLPTLWNDVSEWTRARDRSAWRELILPPDDDYRTTIGHSHFLAFPHELDRRRLARILSDADLVGFEPPITPVISALKRECKSFSKYFQEDLSHFVDRYVEGNQDPRSSAFWRAVRQESLDPSALPGARRNRRRKTSLLGVFDDEYFLPFLGCTETWSSPPGIVVEPLDTPIGGLTHFASAEDADMEEMLQRLFQSMAYLGPGPRALMNQGVLVFQEDQAGEYYLVSGHDIAGADVALVRQDLAPAFVNAFGGVAEPSRVSGWQEVTRCRVHPVDELPEGLTSVVQLLYTMNPPTLRFVGGVQVPGGYLGFDGLLPRVRAHGAREVLVVASGASLACRQVAEFEWELPPALTAGDLPQEFVVAGMWSSPSGEPRWSKRVLQLQPAAVADEFKPLAGGHYFTESCCPGQREVVAGSAIPLLISKPTASSTYDLLDCEPSARFLGPGLGEMSPVPSPGFDWLAVGPKNSPEMLVFVGDPANPHPPAARRSPDGGDRRHWNKAFGRARTVLVRTLEGGYAPIDGFPSLVDLRSRYSRHSPPESAPRVPETRLDTLSLGPPGRRTANPRTVRLADALAALSARRGGLRYRTVQMLLEELVGLENPFLHHELIRAWAECGAVDVVPHQSYGATRVVARRPRFVAVRRGPGVEASLLGLVTSTRRAQVEREASAAGLQLQVLDAGCPWQPAILRLRGSWEEIQAVSIAADLAHPEWLLWGADGELHDSLRAGVELQDLRGDPPPQGYAAALFWDWDRRQFIREVQPGGRVRVEQRIHPQTCSIFVVLVEEQVVAWTYIRNWALLCAYEAAGLAPFVVDPKGWVTTRGSSPVHLPLPIGRVCAVVGEGASGPVLDGAAGTVEGYCYPFGRRMTDMVSRVLPPAWISSEGV